MVHMPIKKSAKKALRHNVTRKARNLKKKNKVKTLVKQVKKLALQKKQEEAASLVPQIYKALDKAAKTHVLNKNTASRKKSRITRLVARIEKAPTAEQ